MSISYRRLSSEIKKFHQCQETLHGIHIHYDPSDIFSIKALILGPEDTPYAHGFYLFRLRFDPVNYPYKPPLVTYESRMGDVRFNPNLYTNGKVCVSILNTWNGPQWTSCLSLTAVLNSLQALLNENPLENEPGYENVRDIRSINYKRIIAYENLRITVKEFLSGNIPKDFEWFLPVMRKEFLRNYDSIMKEVQQNVSIKKVMVCTVYGFKSALDYQELMEGLMSLKSYLTLDDEVEPGAAATTTSTTAATTAATTATTADVEPEVLPSSKAKNIKPKPTSRASLFPEGHVEIIDQHSFITYRDKAGKMRWKKGAAGTTAGSTPPP
jgi:ubiquitin-conjugating enzyme E2 Z